MSGPCISKLYIEILHIYPLEGTLRAVMKQKKIGGGGATEGRSSIVKRGKTLHERELVKNLWDGPPCVMAL